MLSKIKEDLQKLADPERAKLSQRFFKTGKGEYGEGDIFLGTGGTQQRIIAKKYWKNFSLKDAEKLLREKIHDYRQTALLILVYKCRSKKTSERERKEMFDIYLRNTKFINNWDLVDVSAPYIIGDYLLDKDRGVLYKLAKNRGLWEKRIAVLSTFAFIRNNDFKDALRISKILLHDKHDLIHKAVGWMLREIGNRDRVVEEKFLKRYSKTMPRMMLRCAIEKFGEEKRKFYMRK